MSSTHLTPPSPSLFRHKSDTNSSTYASGDNSLQNLVIQETTSDVGAGHWQSSAIFVASSNLCLTDFAVDHDETAKKGDNNGEKGPAETASSSQAERTNSLYPGFLADVEGRFSQSPSARMGAVSNDADGTQSRDHSDSRGAAAGDTAGSPTEATGATRAEVAPLLFLALSPDFYGDLTDARSVRPLCLYTVQWVCDQLELDLPPEVESAFLSQLMDIAHEAIEARFATMDWRL